MNIAIINVLAKSGSTGKITYNLYKQLRESGHKVAVYYGRNDPAVHQDEEDFHCLNNGLQLRLNVATVRFWGDEGLHAKNSTRRLLKMLDTQQVDAVYLLNIHGYYINQPMLFDYLKRQNIKVIYVMLDEYPFLGKCTYSFDCEKFKTECHDCPQVKEYPASFFLDRSNEIFHMKQAAYRDLNCTFVGIEYSVNRAKESAVMPKNAKYAALDEAVDLRGLFYPRDTAALRKKLKIDESKVIILTVAVYPSERKGAKYFLEVARLLENDSHYQFVHVGFGGDPAECPKNYLPISFVKDQTELAAFYSLGDLFVCTSLAETIPAACLEALSCGTPLLGFNISGTPYCADAAHGTFVNPRDPTALAEVIKKTEQKTQEMIDSCRNYAMSRFDAVEYSQKLEALLYK